MKTKQKIKFLALLVLTIILILTFPQTSEIFMNPHQALLEAGPLAPFIYGLLMILAILIAPIPSSPLVIIAGAVFGPWKAMLYTLISATIGSTIAFLIGRFFLRDYFKAKLENSHMYKKFKGKDNKNIAYTVFIFHLLPQVSFDLVSYLAGATGLNIFVYIIITFLAMIPVVFLLSFFGSFLEPYQNILLIVLGLSLIAHIVHQFMKEKKSD